MDSRGRHHYFYFVGGQLIYVNGDQLRLFAFDKYEIHVLFAVALHEMADFLEKYSPNIKTGRKAPRHCDSHTKAT